MIFFFLSSSSFLIIYGCLLIMFKCIFKILYVRFAMHVIRGSLGRLVLPTESSPVNKVITRLTQGIESVFHLHRSVETWVMINLT